MTPQPAQSHHPIARTQVETAAIVNLGLRMAARDDLAGAAYYMAQNGVPLTVARRVLFTTNRRPA